MKRTGPGWSEPIVDADIRRRALELAERLEAPSGFGPNGIPDAPPMERTGTVRAKSAIDAAMSSCDEHHLTATDEEIDGVLAAGAMGYRVDLPEIPAWLARRGGITEAAKTLAAIVIAHGPCTEAAMWAHTSDPNGARYWSHYLAEALAVGIVQRTTSGALTALRRVA